MIGAYEKDGRPDGQDRRTPVWRTQPPGRT